MDFDEPQLSFDIDEQRQHVAAEKWRDHLKWCDKMVDSQRMNLSGRRAALKILVNEAFQRDVWRCRAEFRKFGVDSLKLTDSFAHDKSPKERLEIEIEHIKREWHQIAMAVLDDMAHFDLSALVLKHLSCMCVFIPDSICREYGDNADARQQRMDNMRELISRLNEEGKLFTDEPQKQNRLESPQKSSKVSPSLGPRGAYYRFEEGTQALEDEDFGEFQCPPSTENRVVDIDLL